MTNNVSLDNRINDAVTALRAGGVVAYPTEHCFGLGCDPKNDQALERLISIKQRQADQGLILIAADLDQVSEYADIDSLASIEQIKALLKRDGLKM